jgi:hypothetical protein
MTRGGAEVAFAEGGGDVFVQACQFDVAGFPIEVHEY